MAQISEKILRKSLKELNVWFLKIQNLHFTPTPADFLVLSHKFRYLIEVKEISSYKGYESFSFNRLTQEESLIEFNDFDDKNQSYILFNFREKTVKKSSFFIVHIGKYIKLKKSIGKQSLNIDDFNKHFIYDKIDVLKGGILDLHID